MWPSLDSRNTSSHCFSTGDWPEQLHSNPNLTLTLSRIRIGTRPDVIKLRSHFTMTSTSSAHLICLCGAMSAPGTLLADPEIPISVEICYCNPLSPYNRLPGRLLPSPQLISVARNSLETHSLPQLPGPHPLLLLHMWLPLLPTAPRTQEVVLSRRNHRANSRLGS